MGVDIRRFSFYLLIFSLMSFENLSLFGFHCKNDPANHSNVPNLGLIK